MTKPPPPPPRRTHDPRRLDLIAQMHARTPVEELSCAGAQARAWSRLQTLYGEPRALIPARRYNPFGHPYFNSSLHAYCHTFDVDVAVVWADLVDALGAFGDPMDPPPATRLGRYAE